MCEPYLTHDRASLRPVKEKSVPACIHECLRITILISTFLSMITHLEMYFVTSCFLLAFLARTEGYRSFQSLIPNGDQVPHPCKPNVRWQGVGHQNALGGGVRNLFGKDFHANGKKWGETLCRKDSDGDGKTNGEELGDPDCIWVKGQLPKFISGLSHPGICEPLGSEMCNSSNTWQICESTDFECSHIDAPDVRNFTVHTTKLKVPAKETTYMCASFDIPHDQEYHLIATKPHIDNAYVMHHMIYYACDELEEGKQFDTPTECGMRVSRNGRCQGSVGGWTLGSTGDCFNENAGIRIGKGAYKRIMIEYHWNNVDLRDDYVDSSGVTLYFTPKLRKYDAGGLTLGDLALTIAPRQDVTSYHAKCSSDCTKTFLPHPIYITDSLIHMHYLGHSGVIHHRRNGKALPDLARDTIYNYDSPTFNKFDKAVEVRPGDELSLTCNFNSKYRSQKTYYGLGTSDEMCFGFLTYYPKQGNLSMCIDFNDLDICDARLPNMASKSPSLKDLSRCNMRYFNKHALTPIMEVVMAACVEYEKGCNQACIDAVEVARNAHPCMVGDVGVMVLFRAWFSAKNRGPEFVKMMRACDTTLQPIITVNGVQQRMSILKLSDANESSQRLASVTFIVMAALTKLL